MTTNPVMQDDGKEVESAEPMRFNEPCHGDGRAKPVLKSIPPTSMRGRGTASSYDTSCCSNVDELSDCVLVFPVF